LCEFDAFASVWLLILFEINGFAEFCG